jgi:hypothetical protein
VQAKQTTSTPTSANASLSIGFDNVDWNFLKDVYGWAAFQYQAWARGEILVAGNESLSLVLYTDWILEFWVDGICYFGGDFFTFRKAPPVVYLAPGTHKIDLRLVRDVRALGGIDVPTIDVLLELQKTTEPLELARPGILMSDVVDGRLASAAASVTLRNCGKNTIRIVDVKPSNVRYPVSLLKKGAQMVLGGSSDLTHLQDNPLITAHPMEINLIAGQTRSVAFNISLPFNNATSLNYNIHYNIVGENGSRILSITQNLTQASIFAPHKVTYLHPGGIVSYSMLRAPAKNATCKPNNSSSLPVLLGLHGAGLEADNGIVAHALDPVRDLCAWVLFPTGVTPWSGDDWRMCFDNYLSHVDEIRYQTLGALPTSKAPLKVYRSG